MIDIIRTGVDTDIAGFYARTRSINTPQGAVPHSQNNCDQSNGDKDDADSCCSVQHPAE